MQTRGEVGGGGAGNEVAVGIVPERQGSYAHGHPSAFQAPGKLAGSCLAGVIFILVKDKVDRTTRPIAKLGQLCRCQMSADGACGIAKAGLPQRGQVEQAFDQDHGGKMADRLPGKQAALGARQQPVGEGRADTAAVEVDGLAVLAAGKDHTPTEGVTALAIDQPYLQQPIEGIAEGGQMAP